MTSSVNQNFIIKTFVPSSLAAQPKAVKDRVAANKKLAMDIATKLTKDNFTVYEIEGKPAKLFGNLDFTETKLVQFASLAIKSTARGTGVTLSRENALLTAIKTALKDNKIDENEHEDIITKSKAFVH
jgi:hypothetical protein